MKTKEFNYGFLYPAEIKILKHIMNKNDLTDFTSINAKALSRETGMSHTTIVRALIDLTLDQVLIKDIEGRGTIKRYKLNPELSISYTDTSIKITYKKTA